MTIKQRYQFVCDARETYRCHETLEVWGDNREDAEVNAQQRGWYVGSQGTTDCPQCRA